jgi:iron-sulfur cluster assembly protein
MVTLQPKALEHVIELMMEGGLTPDTHNLRVGIKGGGCSGLSYTMDFDDKIEPTDEVVQADGLKVVIDRKSLLYLYGTQLTYSDGLNGKGFAWENPNASRTCGCGESFSYDKMDS